MVDISANPRVSQLLGRIEASADARDVQEQGSASWVKLNQRVDDDYRELGKYVHWLMRQDRGSVEKIRDEADRYQRRREEMLARLGQTSTTGTTAPTPSTIPRVREELPLVSAELVERDDNTDVPDGIEFEEMEWPAVQMLQEIVDLDVTVGGITSDGRAREDMVRDVASQIEWVRALKDLMAMVGKPRTLSDADAASAQGNRLLNATTGMEVRWLEFPDSVQVSLVGFLGSYARHVQEVAETDVEARLTLGRLTRYQAARGLPAMRVLDPRGKPEYDSWAEDCRQWWEVLSPGLGA